MNRPVLRSELTLCLLLALAGLALGCRETPAADATGRVAGIYVMAGASDGDGSEAKPFGSLAEAQQAGDEGDTIYLLSDGSGAVLDGGIHLSRGQKLIGLGADGEVRSDGGVLLTNTTDHLDGVVIELSSANEIAGLHLVDLESHGIRGTGPDLSGTHIHHVQVSGAIESEELLWSVFLETDAGSLEDIRITDSLFRNGNDLAGIQILHLGDSSGRYRFERNRFTDLGGRAYHLWSQGSSRIVSEILDSSVDNIGLEDRNSDSILPHLWDNSEQTVSIQRFRYDNTRQVGNRSNTGTEAFLMGAPFPDTEHYCNGCRLTLEISDSIYRNPVTDGIQLVNFGSNSVLDVTIRNTVILGAKPQQVGGGISLVPQNEKNTGSRTTLLVENSDVIGSSQYGFALSDTGEGHTSIVDLGGGELGSVGNNRILASALGEVKVINAKPVARNNWWGVAEPRLELEGETSGVDWKPALEADPRPD